jgi:hypothetical protein
VPITHDRWDPEGLIVIDTEAPSLDAPPFAVAGIVYDFATRRVSRSWTSRCPTPATCTDWVKEHVLPVIDDPRTGVPVDVSSYGGLCRAWREFYGPYRTTHAVLAHVAWPLELGFLADAHRDQVQHSGPYPLIDLATTLADHGHDPRSVDSYLAAAGVEIVGVPHHPLYDAHAALAAWRHLSSTRAKAYRRAAWHPRTWSKRSRCPHQDIPSRQGTLETLLVDSGRKLWRCTLCGHIWSI